MRSNAENQPDKRRELLLRKASDLPLRPGVYLMKNAADRVIYVGKSRALRNRVSSYFERSANHSVKTARMVAQVADFEFILCDTEIEALALENKLIKLHRPKYNIRLKDDKSYPYIRLSRGSAEQWQTLTVTRQRLSDRAVYFGPYTGVGDAYEIVNTVKRVLGLPSCKHRFPADIGKVRPCVYAQIGQCLAPCLGEIGEEEYAAMTARAAEMLRGNFKEVRDDLLRQMREDAEALRFERAAKCRDRVAALEKLLDKQKVVGSPDTCYDAVAFYENELCACLAVAFIRAGSISDTAYLLFGSGEITDEAAILSALYDLYRRREETPKELCFGFRLSDPEEFAASFVRTKLSFPERGDKKATLELLRDNARIHAEESSKAILRENKALVRLAQLLRLETLPERIEAVDISNFGDEQITAGLVLFTDGKPDKSGYRTYKIRSTGGKQDDYGSMREAISRRLDHADTQPLPDLLLLDGGVGQVHTVKSVLEEKQFSLPVYGMVKDEYHKTRTLTDGEHEIGIAGEQSVFTLIYRIQEEVHRYTVGRMLHGKRSTLKKSVLLEIDGIGEKKAAALLEALEGLAGIKNATEEELAAVKGITKKDARAVFAWAQRERKDTV